MGFSNMNGLPRISDFRSAERVYNNIKPIRGTTLRPLGKRRDKHYAIEKISDTRYACTLYGHRVITYTKETKPGEGTLGEVSLCGHDTVTTRGFITRVLGTDCYSHKGKTYIEIGKRATQDPETGKYRVTGAYYLPSNHTLQIRHAEVFNPVPVKKQVLDREVTKELRDTFKDSMADAEAMLSLGMARLSSGNGMSDGGYDPFARHAYFRGQFLDDLTKEEVAEYLWLTGSRIMHDKFWQTQKLQYNIQTQKYEEAARPNPPYRAYIVDALYRVAQQDAIEIHKEVDVPIGQRA
jgi:hypothetical protein